MEKPIGKRPVLILSRNASIQVRDHLIVAQVTTHARHIPAEVPLHKKDGMPRECVVNLDVIYTIPKSELVEKITELSLDKQQYVNKALKYVLGLF
jgi:mRNA interferase MazF